MTFHPTTPFHTTGAMAASYTTAGEGENESVLGVGAVDPFDFSYYMDQVRLFSPRLTCRVLMLCCVG